MALPLVLALAALRVCKGTWLHRAAGCSSVLLMAGVALSSFFIRGSEPFHLHGFSAIHLLSVTTQAVLAFAIARGATRQASGTTVVLPLGGRPERLTGSRLHASLFKAR